MKNLKLFSIVLCLGLFLGACAGVQPVQDVNPPENVRVDIMVSSPTDTELEARTERAKLGCNSLNDEDACKLSNMAYIIDGTLYFDLFSAMGTRDIVNMKRDIMKTEKYTDIRDAEIWINSGGGSAFTGLSMADELLAARERGWKITTKASGIVASAAVPVFASGNVRITMPGTIFMVHEPAMFKWPGKETASMIRSQNELMGMLQKRYMKYLVYGSEIDLAKWQEMERKTTWFDADTAKGFGLVTGLVDIGME
jgi:ATP-dependent protease ClpP protease subunit